MEVNIIKGKRKVKFKLLLVFAILIMVILTAYEYWLNSPSSTPELAILKYCKVKSLTYSQQNVKIQETKIIDPDYGNQFTVSGVTGEVDSNITFFYLKHSNNGWKVISAGTGP